VLVTHDRALAERAGNRWEIREGKLTPPVRAPVLHLDLPERHVSETANNETI